MYMRWHDLQKFILSAMTVQSANLSVKLNRSLMIFCVTCHSTCVSSNILKYDWNQIKLSFKKV